MSQRQHLQSYESISGVHRRFKDHFFRGSKRIAIQSVHQQCAEELETTRLLIALKSQAGIGAKGLTGMKGAILVFVAIHCVEFAKNALGIVAHERSQRTESTAVPFAVCAAACYTHPTANEFKTKYLNLKINRSSITNIH